MTDCSVETCTTLSSSKGLCRTHYSRYRRHGDPLGSVPILVRKPRTKQETLLGRLLERTDKQNVDGCWVWQGSTRNKGYGFINYEGKSQAVHRLSYEHYNDCKLIPETLVRHRCDNPPCWNPAHLVVGSHQDNSDDKLARGRSNKGERHGQAKLTAEVVLSIRADHTFGMSYTDLATKYQIKKMSLPDIILRRTWKHI